MAEFPSASGQRALRSRSEVPESSAATAPSQPIEVKPVVKSSVSGSAPELKRVHIPASPPRAARQPVGPPPIPKLTVDDMPIEPMLTTDQAAVILARKADVVKKWRKRERKGPSFIRYPDGAIRYRLSDIFEFINKHRVQR